MRYEKIINTWDRIMMAITFAEADEEQTAREFLSPARKENRPDQRPQKKNEKRPDLRA